MSTQAFVKGDKTRLVSTSAQEVAARFDGFKPAAEVSAESADRAELQRVAKELGIKANQSNEALAKAIAEFKPADEVVEGNKAEGLPDPASLGDQTRS